MPDGKYVASLFKTVKRSPWHRLAQF